jgi:hypothetical protein
MIITDTCMTSSETPVRADRADGAWTVTGYPPLAGRRLTRNEAITMMSLAEHEAAGHGGDATAASWRRELGLP